MVPDADECGARVREEAAEEAGDGGGAVELEHEAAVPDAELEGGGGVEGSVPPLDTEADDELAAEADVEVTGLVEPVAGNGGPGGHGCVDAVAVARDVEGSAVVGFSVVVGSLNDYASVAHREHSLSLSLYKFLSLGRLE